MSQETDECTDSQSSITNTLAWFLIGASIGTAIGILYAPKSGKDTRQYLTDKVQSSKDAVADTSQSIVETSKEMFDRGKQLVEDAANLFERGRKLVKG